MRDDAAVGPAARHDDAARHRVAATIEWATRAGFAAMALQFAAYAAGWLPTRIAPSELERHWSQPLRRYLEDTGAPTGWRWLQELGSGDTACLLGIALLCSASALGLAAAIPASWAGRRRAVAALCTAQLGVIGLAASGLLAR